MAYNFLQATDLSDALHDSESYMKGFYEPIPELQRITRGKPGKIPKGKPRVTDGTLAAIRRETPKQIIQQLPTGRVHIIGNEEMEDLCNAVLSDVIIPNANSGGTPFSKAKRGLKHTIDIGSAWAYCFFNQSGSVLHADYKIKYYRDILFEKGKSSEFDTNYMPMIDWLTEGDLKWIIYREQQRKLTKTNWDLKALQELLDKGPGDKDYYAKTPEERKANADNGYFKLVYFFQRGVSANFYVYAPTIKKALRTWTNPDPRGIIPLHGLVPEDDDDNPLGIPLAAISAGKQNLLDFDMQMYQYGQGLQYSPPVKKWGNTPAGKIKLIPDNVIEMDGSPATDDFHPVELANAATANFASNYGLIKTQIQSEMGRRSDTSVSGSSGNPDFSKTPAGVQQSQLVTDISNNDLMVSYELWQGRIWETCLNIHFAESKGTKSLELERDTLKRLGLEEQPKVNYDKEVGKIKFTVNAGTAKKLSDAEQVANMQQLAPDMSLQNAYYLGQVGWKLDIGEFEKAKLQRMNIDSIDKILSKMDDQEAEAAKKAPYPRIDAPNIRVLSADLSPEQIAAVLQQQGGVEVPPGADQHIDLVDIINDPTTPASVKAQIQARAGLQPDVATQAHLQALRVQAETTKAGSGNDKGKSLGEAVSWKPGDLKPGERAQALSQVGITADPSQEPTPNETLQATDAAIKTDKHVQDTALALHDHVAKHSQPDTEPDAQDKHEVKESEPVNA